MKLLDQTSSSTEVKNTTLSRSRDIFNAQLASIAAGGAAAINKVREFSSGRAAEVGGLSPEIARAQAQAEVRDLHQRLRSARRHGATFASQIEGESKASTAFQGLKEEALAPAMRDLAEATNNIAAILASAREGADNSKDFIEFATKAAKRFVGLSDLEQGIKAFAKFFGKEEKEEFGSFFGDLAQERHLQPSGDAWPGAQSSGASFVAGKFNAPPGALAGGDFFLRGFPGEGGL